MVLDSLNRVITPDSCKQGYISVERGQPTITVTKEILVSINGDTPKMVGLQRENPIRMDDLGVPLFQETSKWSLFDLLWRCDFQSGTRGLGTSGQKQPLIARWNPFARALILCRTCRLDQAPGTWSRRQYQ